ncbi:cyclase family protein [Enterococcus sp. AZ103]|uniref:cyclase family protein n=1 Tax=Enterococcus sp. AZ103 TaxID=2774628 RepID=UPI003F24E066
MSDITKSIELLKNQKWVDLSHNIHEGIPYFQSFRPMKEETLMTVKENGFFAKEYQLVTQYGTHIDAPIHFVEDSLSVDQLPIKNFLLPLIVINKEKEVIKNSDYSLTVKDINNFEDEYGIIPENSFVAFASGWSKRWNNPTSFYNTGSDGQAHTPGWSIGALQFLHEKRNVTAIGHETLDTDSAIDCKKNSGLIGELYWLQQKKFQIEVLNHLTELPAIGGAISIGVPKVEGAPGFNVRAIAIVPKN